ncbi:hypothetical protein DH2020_029140 [Rehmannia glutinosa]|uniref:Uncharacterized protein n=1 Tax=Rehmannia glutinosa TaxID=99300 RepID=A0ABR0VPE7_REHGL
MPRTLPNWLINGASRVLDTHAGEDSFELYKHTLLAPDQFALLPFEFTLLEELMAHNFFRSSLEEQQREVARLSEALRGAEAGSEKAIQEAKIGLMKENSSLLNKVQGLEMEVTKLKEVHESELNETYDTGRKEGFQDYITSVEYTSAIQKAREEGVKSFLNSHSYETLVAHRATIYLFEGFERCRDQALQENAFKRDFDLRKLDCFHMDDLEKTNEGEVAEEEGLDVVRDVDEVDETDEWTELMQSHLASTEPPPPAAAEVDDEDEDEES